MLRGPEEEGAIRVVSWWHNEVTSRRGKMNNVSLELSFGMRRAQDTGYGGTAQRGDEGGKSNLIFTMELRVGPG